VFNTGTDPVLAGFVASFNHPGGNITGVYGMVGALTAKHLGLLHDLVPNAKMIAVLADATSVVPVKDVREAATPLGLQLTILIANTEGEIEAAFASLNQQRADAMIVPANPFFFTRAKLIAALAARHAGGDLVGINSAFIAVGKSNPGMSFAIPINMVRSLVDQVLEFGDIRRGALGFIYDDFTSTWPRNLVGAVVRAVDPRSAAERAGLRPGDLVTELGGTPVRDAADLQIRLALLRVGEIAEFAVSRRGGTVTVRAEMAERDPAARSR
jgi:membrane-associated protease RseP (regulator of RpoE activity)